MASITADILIAVGLILEYVVIGRAIVATGDANRESDEKVAAANARALEAQAELARFKAPRMLSPEQRARISKKLGQFSGQQFVGSISQGVGDAWLLWNQIVGALREANWVLISPSGLAVGEPPAGIPAMTRSGLSISYWVKTWVSSPSIHIHAEALAAALVDEGIDAFAWPAHGNAVESNPDAIRIEIGPKLA